MRLDAVRLRDFGPVHTVKPLRHRQSDRQTECGRKFSEFAYFIGVADTGDDGWCRRCLATTKAKLGEGVKA